MRTNPLFAIIIGYTNTGKTTYARKIIDTYRKSCDRVLVLTPHEVEWTDCELIDLEQKNYYRFSGIKRSIVFDNPLDLITDQVNHFRNGLIVFDDCRFYFENVTDLNLKRLFISRKQRGIDIIAIAHGFTEVPPKFFTFASDIVLFKTNDSIDTRKKYLRSFDELKKLQEEVNKHKEFNHYQTKKML